VLQQETPPDQAQKPKKWLSPLGGLIYGGIILFALLVLYKFCSWILKDFLDATEWLRFLINRFLLTALTSVPRLQEFASSIVSLILILPFVWLLGHVEVSAILKKIHFWWIEKKTGLKFLCCVTMKNSDSFPGKYAIGCVTRIYRHKEKTCCAVCFPNLGGFITLIDVPIEDVVYNDRSPAEVILAGFTGGALISGVRIEIYNYEEIGSRPLPQ